MVVNVVFLGPPGCGKGTQAALVAQELGYKKVSTGDLLREIAKKDNAIGREIKDILSRGDLVSSQIVDKLIDSFISDNLDINGIVFDGYPRNIEQAESLNRILLKYNSGVDKIFNFAVSDDVLIKRITGRYTCNSCGSIYNNFFNKTIVKDVCDKCHSYDFNKRSDDSEEVVIERLKIFKDSTAPLLDYYGEKIIKIDAEQSVSLISKEILQNLID